MSRPKSHNGTNSHTSNNGTKPGHGIEKRQIVGQYMLGKTIGEGTFGKVKLAVHIPTGEKVAVKLLEKGRIKEQADVRRVNREIKILKKARHGNIVQLYEVLDTKNTIFLMMECAEGGEMFDYIVAQKHVPEIQACKFFHQIIDGVEILHKNEITHRDLKPENLLLKASPDGWIVKIVDFGLSNTHEGGKLLTTACGSPCYAAPEMIAGRKYFGPLADLWSIGVILFALVCGYLPFEDPNTSVLYKKILSGEYSPAKWISPEVKNLIKCILEVDPKKRYRISDIRKHPWYNLVQESSVPKEQFNVYENVQTRQETLEAIAALGIDTQTVLDGVASRACNSYTAMYYLLEQKHRALRLKEGKKENTNKYLRQNTVGIPLTGSATQVPTEDQISRVDTAPSGEKTTSRNIPSASNNRPKPLETSNNSTHSGTDNDSLISTTVVTGPPKFSNPVPSPRGSSSSPRGSNSNVPGKLKPLNGSNHNTTYLQTPGILTQGKVVSGAGKYHTNQNGANAAMPSLDAYMKQGLSLPPQQGSSVGNGNDNASRSSRRVVNRPPVPKAGMPEIPKLNLKKAPSGGKTDVLVSQTSRPNVPIVEPAGSVSARPAVGVQSSSSGGVEEILAVGPPSELTQGERPNTRRSHTRESVKSAGNSQVAEAGPGIGTMQVEPLAVQENSSLVANENISTDQNVPSTSPKTADVRTGSILTERDRTTKKEETDVGTTATATALVPRRPQGSGATPRGTFSQQGVLAAGRRTKTGIAVSQPAKTPAAPTVAKERTPQSMNPRAQAMRNKLAAQGTLGGY